jgi:hypothetical protein
LITFEDVAEIVGEFRTCIPVEGDRLEWCVNGKALAWERPLSKKDLLALGEKAPKGSVLAIHVEDLVVRDAWVQTVPGACFVSGHFALYPAVLVDMNLADKQLLRELLDESYQWLVNRDNPKG